MTTLVVIDSAMAGLVIGRGGSKIQSIQRDTHTIIKISNGESQGTSHVKIIGTEESRLKAMGMIKSIAGNILRSESSNEPLPPPRKPKKSRPARPFRPSCSAHTSHSPDETASISAEQWAEIERDEQERTRELLKSYPPIKKDFYVEHPDITAMSDTEVSAFRFSKNCISVELVMEGASCPLPIPRPAITFQHAFHAFPEILKVIYKQGFTEPSPVQCQAWPIIMSGHDLIAIAQTGSGKTLAYILPALIHLIRQPVERHLRIGPSVLILGPTRELVQQIEVEIKKYVYGNIHVMSIYGGVGTNTQADALYASKPDILVATPGRLNDLVSTMTVKLDHVSYLVLDEADRMLDMGFKNQIELALRHVRRDKQTILTSATWPEAVKQLANYYTSNPLHLTVGSLNLTTVSSVRQQTIVLQPAEKEIWLDKYFEKPMPDGYKIIIFMRKKISVDKLFTKFFQKNIKCRCIHGGLLQGDRESALYELRCGIVPILIATDVASRGLDIKDLNLVINYDFPKTIEEYVHRVGRTGRAGKQGDAITLFSKEDEKYAVGLIDVLEKSKQPVPPELYLMAIKLNN